jgi:hypothetical protein
MMKRLALFGFIIAALLAITSPVYADDAHAKEILKQAREAVGGDEQLKKIQGLNINGQYRRVFGERQLGGDREISIELPNKYYVEDSMNPGGLSTALINYRILNGEHAWNGQSGGGGGMVFRMTVPGGAQATPEQMEAGLRRMLTVEMARYLLAITLAGPDSLTLQYTYAGESDVEDAKADVIDVTGPEKFAVRLFFDKNSHLPLLISYRGPKPRIVTMTRQAGGAQMKHDDVTKARDEVEKKMTAEEPEEVDFYIRLTEHKKVGGLLLPFKFTFLTGEEVSEEFEVSKYQVNPQFKADRFEKH